MSSFTFDPSGQGPTLARTSPLIVVRRYTPGPGGDLSGNQDQYLLLPNVLCLGMSIREGDPGTARFRYILDNAGGSSNGGFPDGFADLIPADATGDYVVKQGDRLVVHAVQDDGTSEKIFDGHAEAPDVTLSGGTQSATFQARGVGAREWDSPIGGAKYRDGDDPANGNVVDTDLPVRFNPYDDTFVARPNATPVGADYAPPGGVPSDAFPVFLEPTPSRETTADELQEDEDKAEDGDTRRTWTLGMAARYLIEAGNPPKLPSGDPGRIFVNPGNVADLDDTLKAIKPVDDGPIDLEDDTTFTREDIPVRDFDASGRPYLDSLKALLWPHGFRFRFDLATLGQGDGTATTRLVIYRIDGLDGDRPANLSLQASGATLDPGRSNVGSIQAQRETPKYNAVQVETDPVLYEVAVTIGPGFKVAAGDAGPDARKKYVRSNWLADAANLQKDRDSYRLFIFDECGDGHWDLKTGAWATTPGDRFRELAQVFNADDPNGPPAYARRYRVPRGKLISRESGKPLSAKLDISLDYGGPTCGVWDGTGTWQPVSGEWSLLRDRLGVRVTADDPNAWNAGNPPKDNDIIKRGGVIPGVEGLAKPTDVGFPRPYRLRLTVVIASDQGIDAPAKRRPASPTPFSIAHREDCRDHFRKEVIDKSSPLFAGSPLKPDPKTGQIVVRDDTPRAKAYSESVREAGERGEWFGRVTIPRYTGAYRVGTRIAMISGVNASLQTNAATQAGESPAYPAVVGITWDFDGKQATTLELSGVADKPVRP